MFQVEERTGRLERQQDQVIAMLEERIATDGKHLIAHIEDAKRSWVVELQAESDHRQESQQALVEQLTEDINNLRAATHTKLTDLERTCSSTAR
jgi:translation elongation factor EF-Ts